MSEPFLAEIMIFAGNFAPRNWALCNGQIMPLSQNTALFSLLGTTYGGDGRTTFALPNLMGRAPIHVGQGPGLTTRDLGDESGSQSVTLLTSEMPAHNHTPAAYNGGPGVADATNDKVWCTTARGINAYTTSAPNVTMNATALSVAGGSNPHNNMQPYLGLTFVIALQGIFPPRN